MLSQSFHCLKFQTSSMVSSLFWLVVSDPLKNMKVKWHDDSQYTGKHVPNHHTLSHFAPRVTLGETLPGLGGAAKRQW